MHVFDLDIVTLKDFLNLFYRYLEDCLELFGLLEFDFLVFSSKELEELWVFRLHLHLLLGRAVSMSEDSNH